MNDNISWESHDASSEVKVQHEVIAELIDYYEDKVGALEEEVLTLRQHVAEVDQAFEALRAAHRVSWRARLARRLRR